MTFIEGFIFAKAVNRDLTQLLCTAVATGDDSYTVAALVGCAGGQLDTSGLCSGPKDSKPAETTISKPLTPILPSWQ